MKSILRKGIGFIFVFAFVFAISMLILNAKSKVSSEVLDGDTSNVDTLENNESVVLDDSDEDEIIVSVLMEDIVETEENAPSVSGLYSASVNVSLTKNDTYGGYLINWIGNGTVFSTSDHWITIGYDIPSTIDGYTIVGFSSNISIRHWCNNHYSNYSRYTTTHDNQVTVTYIKLPSTIKYIGDSAFARSNFSTTRFDLSSCTNLEYIGADSFGNASGGTRTIEKFASNQSKLKTIGKNAFYNAWPKRYVENKAIVAPKVTSIGEGAFYGCTGLAAFTLDDNEVLKTIGARAFEGCTKIETIVLPSSLTSVGNYAFKDCTNIVGADINADIVGNTGLFYNCISLTNITVNNNPNLLTKIGPYAFYNCTKLIGFSTSLFGNLESIGEYAFYYTQFTSFTIPSTCTSIGKDAFASSKLTSVDLSKPASLVLADEVFMNCAELSDVTITENITSIGINLFKGCTSLKTVTYQQNKNSSYDNLLNDGIFSGCINLISVNFYDNGSNITRVPDYAFENCAKLTDLQIIKTNLDDASDLESNALVSIGKYAFYGAGFNQLKLTNTALTSMGEYAFAYMPNLTNVVINIPNISSHNFFHNIKLAKLTVGSNVGAVGEYAFAECSALVDITLENAIMGDYMFYEDTALTDITLPQSITTIGKFALAKCVELTNVTLGTAHLGVSMFEYDTKLTSITLSSDMTEIPARAFANSYLTSITIPQSVVTVGDEAFMYSKSLESVTLNNHMIGKSMFEGCTKLLKITIPSCKDNATEDEKAIFGNRAFYGCTSLLRADLSNATILGAYMFYGCEKLISESDSKTDIIIPSSVTMIGDHTFDGCTSIYSFENNSTIISAYMFANATSLNRVEIKSTVDTVGEYAFMNCSGVNTVEIKNKNTSTGEFKGCTGLTSVSIAAGNGSNKFSNVISIEASMFEGCTNLSNLDIDYASLQMIKASAFKNCSSLETITINNSVTKIEEGILNGCSKLTTIIMPFIGSSRNASGTSASASTTFGYIFGTASYASSNLVKFYYSDSASAYYGAYIPQTLLEVRINDDTVVKRGAFYNLNVTGDLNIIMSNVTTIEDYAFYNANSLVQITVPSTVETIGTYTFAEIDKLKEATIGGTVLGTHMFENCKSLTKVELTNVTNVSGYAFNGCTALNSVSLNSTGLITISEYAFNNCSSIGYIDLPSSLVTIGDYAFNNCTRLYLYANNNISALPDNLTTLGNYAFNNCDALVNLLINEKLTTVGSYAFANCNSLEFVEFRKNVLGTFMFYNDNKLSSVYLKEDTTTISESAFQNCTGLFDISLPSGLKTINNNAFRNSGLIYLSVPSGVTTLGTYVFAEMPNLVKASLKNNVMNEYMFYNSTKLNEVEYSGNITTISNYAYYGCTSYTTLTWPKNVTTIGYMSYANIYNLTTLVVPDTVTTINRNAFYNDDVVNLTIPFVGYKSTINDDVYTNTYASTHRSVQTHLGWIFGANSVSSSGSYSGAFTTLSYTTGRSYTVTYYNEGGGLEPDYVDTMHVDVPKSLKKITVTKDEHINYTAFHGLYTVTDLTISSYTTYISEGVMYGMTSLKNLTVPFIGRTKDFSNTTWYNSDIKYLGTGSNPTTGLLGYFFSHYTRFAAYYGTGGYSGSNVQSFDTTNTYNSVSQTYNTSNSTVTYYIPKSLVSLKVTNQSVFGVGALSGINQLTSLSLNTNYTGIREYAFSRNTKLTSFTIPSTVSTVGNYAFSGSTNLNKVVINNNKVSSYMFNGCTGLNDVTFNGANTTIGTYAFSGCTALRKVIIPSNVISVGDSAYAGCSNINYFETYKIGSSTTGKNATFASMFGTTSNSNMTAQTAYYSLSASETRYLPSNLATIILHGVVNEFAFANNTLISNNVTLANDVTSIGQYAFWKSSITEIRIPYGITTKDNEDIINNMGVGVFMDAANLTKVTFAEGIISIPNYTFKNATSLVDIIFESSTVETEIRYVSNNVYRKYVKTAGALGPNLTEYVATNEYISAGPDKIYGTNDDITSNIIYVNNKFYIDNQNGTYQAMGADILLGTDDDVLVDVNDTFEIVIIDGNYYKDFKNGSYSSLTITSGSNTYTYDVDNKFVDKNLVDLTTYDSNYYLPTEVGYIYKAAGVDGILNTEDDVYRILVNYDKNTNTYSFSANDITDVVKVNDNYYKTYYDNVYKLITITDYETARTHQEDVYNKLGENTQYDSTKTYYLQNPVYAYSQVETGNSFNSSNTYVDSNHNVVKDVDASNFENKISGGLYVRTVSSYTYTAATINDYDTLVGIGLYVKTTVPYTSVSSDTYDSNKTYYTYDGTSYTEATNIYEKLRDDDLLYTFAQAESYDNNVTYYKLNDNKYEVTNETINGGNCSSYYVKTKVSSDATYVSNTYYYTENNSIYTVVNVDSFDNLKGSLYVNEAHDEYTQITSGTQYVSNIEYYDAAHNLISNVIVFSNVSENYYLKETITVTDSEEVDYSVNVGEYFSAGLDKTPGTEDDLSRYSKEVKKIINENVNNVSASNVVFDRVIVGDDGYHYLVLKESMYKGATYESRREIYVQFGEDRMLGTADDVIVSSTNVTSAIAPVVVTPTDIHEAGYVASYNITVTNNANIMTSSFVEIGDEAFFNTSALKTLTLSANLTTIGDRAFIYSGLESITIPENVKNIGTYTFAYNKDMTTATLNSTTNGTYMFAENTKLETVRITENTTQLNTGLFYDCINLTTVIFITHYSREVRIPYPKGEELTIDDDGNPHPDYYDPTTKVSELALEAQDINNFVDNYEVEDANGTYYYNIKGNIYYVVVVENNVAGVTGLVYKVDETYYDNIIYSNGEYYASILEKGTYVEYDNTSELLYAYAVEGELYLSGGNIVIIYDNAIHYVNEIDGYYYESVTNNTINNLYNRWTITEVNNVTTYSYDLVARDNSIDYQVTSLAIGENNTYGIRIDNSDYYYISSTSNTLSTSSDKIYDNANHIELTKDSNSGLYIHRNSDNTETRLNASSLSVEIYFVGENNDYNVLAVTGNDDKHYIPLGNGAFIAPDNDNKLTATNYLNQTNLVGVSSQGLIGNNNDYSLVLVGNNLYVDKKDNTYEYLEYELVSPFSYVSATTYDSSATYYTYNETSTSYTQETIDSEESFNTNKNNLYIKTGNYYNPINHSTVRIVGSSAGTLTADAITANVKLSGNETSSSVLYIDRNDGTYQIKGSDNLFNTSDDLIYLFDGNDYKTPYVVNYVIQNTNVIKDIYPNSGYVLSTTFDSSKTYYTFNSESNVYIQITKYEYRTLYVKEEQHYVSATTYYSETKYYIRSGEEGSYTYTETNVSSGDFTSNTYYVLAPDTYVLAPSPYDSSTTYYREDTGSTYIAVSHDDIYDFDATTTTYENVSGTKYCKIEYEYNNIVNIITRYDISGDNTSGYSYNSNLVALGKLNGSSNYDVISGRTIDGVTTTIDTTKTQGKYYLKVEDSSDNSTIYRGYGYDHLLNTDDDSTFAIINGKEIEVFTISTVSGYYFVENSDATYTRYNVKNDVSYEPLGIIDENTYNDYAVLYILDNVLDNGNYVVAGTYNAETEYYVRINYEISYVLQNEPDGSNDYEIVDVDGIRYKYNKDGTYYSYGTNGYLGDSDDVLNIKVGENIVYENDYKNVIKTTNNEYYVSKGNNVYLNIVISDEKGTDGILRSAGVNEKIGDNDDTYVGYLNGTSDANVVGIILSNNNYYINLKYNDSAYYYFEYGTDELLGTADDVLFYQSDLNDSSTRKTINKGLDNQYYTYDDYIIIGSYTVEGTIYGTIGYEKAIFAGSNNLVSLSIEGTNFEAAVGNDKLPYQFNEHNYFFKYTNDTNNKSFTLTTTNPVYAGSDHIIGTEDDETLTTVVIDNKNYYYLNTTDEKVYIYAPTAFDMPDTVYMHKGNDNKLGTQDDWYQYNINNNLVTGLSDNKHAYFAGFDSTPISGDDFIAYLGENELPYQELYDYDVISNTLTTNLDNTYYQIDYTNSFSSRSEVTTHTIPLNNYYESQRSIVYINVNKAIKTSNLISAGRDGLIGTQDDIDNVLVSLTNGKKYYTVLEDGITHYYASLNNYLGVNDIEIFVGNDNAFGTKDDYYNVTGFLNNNVGNKAYFAGYDLLLNTNDDLFAVLGDDYLAYDALYGSDRVVSSYTNNFTLNNTTHAYDNTYKLYDLANRIVNNSYSVVEVTSETFASYVNSGIYTKDGENYTKVENTEFREATYYQLNVSYSYGYANDNIYVGKVTYTENVITHIAPDSTNYTSLVVVTSSVNGEKYISTNVISEDTSNYIYKSRGKDGLLNTNDDVDVHTVDNQIGNEDDYYYANINSGTKYGAYRFVNGVKTYYGNNTPFVLSAQGRYMVSANGKNGNNVFSGDNIFFTNDDTYVVVDIESIDSANALPKEITEIGDYAFYSCKRFTGITLYAKDDYSTNQTLVKIGNYAFALCETLDEIEIPYSVSTYGDYIFLDDTNLQRVTFNGTTPTDAKTNNVTTIAKGIFKGCTSLSELYFYDQTGNALPVNTMSPTIVSIQDEAFMNTRMEDDYLELNINSFDDYYNNIYYINNNEYVLVDKNNDTYDSNNTYYRSTRLLGLKLSENVKTIGNYAFKNSDLYEISLPASIFNTLEDKISLGVGVFADSQIENIVFEGSYVYIPESMFEGSELKTFRFTSGGAENTFSSSITEIASKAFKDTNIATITFNSNISKIDDYAFANTKITTLTLTDTLSELSISDSNSSFGVGVFKDNVLLRTVYFGYGIKYIPEEFLAGNKVLENLYFKDYEDNVSKIVWNRSTSSDTYKVTEVIPDTFVSSGTITTLPLNILSSTVTTIGVSAFDGDIKLGNTKALVTNIAYTNSILDNSSNDYNNLAKPGLLFTNNLKSIGAYAFRNTALEMMIITKSVETFGVNVFDGATKLSNVVFLNNTLGDKMFIDCTGLEEVILPDGITEIGAYAFQNCTHLRSVVIPTSVVRIDEGAFANCTSIENLTLPFIGSQRGSTNKEGLFGWIFGEDLYYNINTITINGVEETLDSSITTPFYEEKTLSKHTYETYVKDIVDEYLKDYNQEFVTVTKDDLSTYTYTIETTDSSAYLTQDKYIISATVSTVISSNDATSTVTITSKHKYTNVGYSEETIDYYPAGVTKTFVIKYTKDANFTMLTQKYSASGSVDYNVPSSIKGVTINDETKVSYGAFYRVSLTSIILNDVESFKVDNKTEVEVEENGTTFKTYKLNSDGSLLSNAQKLTEIGDYAFYKCEGLVKAQIPSQITKIGNYAFAYCKNMSIVAIPAQKDILIYSGTTSDTDTEGTQFTTGEYKTNGTNFTYYVQKNTGVTTLGNYSFFHCEAIEEITVPASVTNSGLGSYIFAYCTKLAKLNLLNTGLGVKMFSNCSSLLEVLVPEEVTRIESGTFEYCTKLRYVVIPKAVTYIGEAAFDNCPGLEKLVIPFIGSAKGSTGINGLFGWIFGTASYSGAYAATQYYEASNYRIAYIPSKLTEVYINNETAISYGAFMNCINLKRIVIAQNYVAVKNYANEGEQQSVNAKIASEKLYVTNGMANEYGSIDTLGTLASVTLGRMISAYDLYVDSNITTFGTYAFRNVDKMTSGYLEIKNIASASWAFYDCSSLRYCYLPYATGTMPAGLFAYCTKLQNAIIPDTITSMGQYAFRFTPAITYLQIPYVGVDGSASNPRYSYPYGRQFGSYYQQSLAFIFGPNETYPGNDSNFTGKTARSSNAFSGTKYIDADDESDYLYSIGSSRYYCQPESGFLYSSGTWSCWFYAPRKYSLVVTQDQYIHYGSMNECINPTSTAKDGVGLNALYLSDKLIAIYTEAFIFNRNMAKIGVWDTTNHKIIDVNNGQFRFGNKLTRIDSNAFQNCDSLTDIVFPNSVQYLGKDMLLSTPVVRIVTPFVGYSRGSTGLAGSFGYWVSDDNGYNYSRSHRWYYYELTQYYASNSTNWILVPNTIRTLVITDTTSLSGGSLYGIDYLSKLILPFGRNANVEGNENYNKYLPDEYDSYAKELMSGEWLELYRRQTSAENATYNEAFWGSNYLKSIGWEACYEMDSMPTLYIPSTVESVGTYAFADSNKGNILSTVYLNNNVIGDHMFYYDVYLTSVYAPNVKTINEYAFYDDIRLAYFEANMLETIGNYAFYNNDALVSFDTTVTDNDGNKYNIFEGFEYNGVKYGVETIGAYAFYSCAKLNYQINTNSQYSRLTTIGAYAFYDDDRLATVTVTNYNEVDLTTDTYEKGKYYVKIGGKYIIANEDFSYYSNGTVAKFYKPISVQKVEVVVFDDDNTYQGNKYYIKKSDGTYELATKNYDDYMTYTDGDTYYEIVFTTDEPYTADKYYIMQNGKYVLADNANYEAYSKNLYPDFYQMLDESTYTIETLTANTYTTNMYYILEDVYRTFNTPSYDSSIKYYQKQEYKRVVFDSSSALDSRIDTEKVYKLYNDNYIEVAKGSYNSSDKYYVKSTNYTEAAVTEDNFSSLLQKGLYIKDVINTANGNVDQYIKLVTFDSNETYYVKAYEYNNVNINNINMLNQYYNDNEYSLYYLDNDTYKKVEKITENNFSSYASNLYFIDNNKYVSCNENSEFDANKIYYFKVDNIYYEAPYNPSYTYYTKEEVYEAKTFATEKDYNLYLAPRLYYLNTTYSKAYSYKGTQTQYYVYNNGDYNEVTITSNEAFNEYKGLYVYNDQYDLLGRYYLLENGEYNYLDTSINANNFDTYKETGNLYIKKAGAYIKVEESDSYVKTINDVSSYGIYYRKVNEDYEFVTVTKDNFNNYKNTNNLYTYDSGQYKLVESTDSYVSPITYYGLVEGEYVLLSLENITISSYEYDIYGKSEVFKLSDSYNENSIYYNEDKTLVDEDGKLTNQEYNAISNLYLKNDEYIEVFKNNTFDSYSYYKLNGDKTYTSVSFDNEDEYEAFFSNATLYYLDKDFYTLATKGYGYYGYEVEEYTKLDNSAQFDTTVTYYEKDSNDVYTSVDASDDFSTKLSSGLYTSQTKTHYPTFYKYTNTISYVFIDIDKYNYVANIYYQQDSLDTNKYNLATASDFEDYGLYNNIIDTYSDVSVVKYDALSIKTQEELNSAIANGTIYTSSSDNTYYYEVPEGATYNSSETYYSRTLSYEKNYYYLQTETITYTKAEYYNATIDYYVSNGNGSYTKVNVEDVTDYNSKMSNTGLYTKSISYSYNLATKDSYDDYATTSVNDFYTQTKVYDIITFSLETPYEQGKYYTKELVNGNYEYVLAEGMSIDEYAIITYPVFYKTVTVNDYVKLENSYVEGNYSSNKYYLKTESIVNDKTVYSYDFAGEANYTDYAIYPTFYNQKHDPVDLRDITYEKDTYYLYVSGEYVLATEELSSYAIYPTFYQEEYNQLSITSSNYVSGIYYIYDDVTHSYILAIDSIDTYAIYPTFYTYTYENITLDNNSYTPNTYYYYDIDNQVYVLATESSFSAYATSLYFYEKVYSVDNTAVANYEANKYYYINNGEYVLATNSTAISYASYPQFYQKDMSVVSKEYVLANYVKDKYYISYNPYKEVKVTTDNFAELRSSLYVYENNEYVAIGDSTYDVDTTYYELVNTYNKTKVTTANFDSLKANLYIRTSDTYSYILASDLSYDKHQTYYE